MTWFQWLFSNVGFMPRAICGIWTPGMIFLHNASDFLIWTAYIAIPLVLAKFAYAKRRELPFRRLFWLFGLFILACGTTHLMDIVMFYNPLYHLAGVIKLITALASWGTVFALFHVTPLALRMRSPEDLEREIELRQRAEGELQQAHDHLEFQIQERTSELQRINAELIASDEQFRTMANSIPQLAWIARADGFVFWYNRRWHDYIGTAPGQEAEMREKSVLDPEILPLVQERWKEAVATGQPFEMEFPLRGADGHSRIFLTRMEPVKDAQGNVVRWFGTNTDIDDQKRAQQELTASLSLLAATIESTADGIMALDLAGNIVSHNTKFNTMWRFPDDFLQRLDGPEMRSHAAGQVKDADGFFQLLKQHHSAPETETFDVIEMKDGRTFERYGFPQRVQEKCVGIVVNFRDITERRHAESEREDLLEKEHQALEAAERANAAKDEFLSRMSHELRTPLNAILGFGQILQMQEKQLTTKQNESVQYILKAGRHQLDLVNEVLDIARIQSPDSALSTEAVALSEVVQEAFDILQTLATPNEISLTHQLTDVPPVFILADRQRLLQILLNLLSNAIKYNKSEGQVQVTVEVLPEKRVRFHISDSGHGIAAEDLPKLFVPFARLNESLGVEGTGLGLVLCQRLAQAMNGSIHVESQFGMGSTFSVELPLAQPLVTTESTAHNPPIPNVDRAVATSATAPLAAANLAKHSILLIEDNISNFQLIERLLDDLPDVRLVGAMQGGLGVELAIHHRPDLILLDLHLPDIMGDEVLSRLQANPTTQDIPVIMLSADATPSQISRLLALGARQYLTKPLDVKQFLQTLHEAILAR